MEIQFKSHYTEKDKERVIRKLTEASVKYDRYHPSAPSLAAFEHGALMTPSIFRENIRRTFNLKFNNREMAFIIHEFSKKALQDKEGTMTRGRSSSPSATHRSRSLSSGSASPSRRQAAQESIDNMIDSGEFLTKFLTLGTVVASRTLACGSETRG